MRRSPFRRTRLSFLRAEHLEDRSVPAGNVTASIFEDYDGARILELLGDTEDNRIILRGIAPGVVQVQGHSTTINGGKGSLIFSDLNGLFATLSIGNDTIRTHDLKLETVYLDGGFGDDEIRIQSTTLADGLRDASLVVTGDPEVVVVPPDTLVNGRDKIELTGTRISSSGQYAPIIIYGDSVEDLDTPDDIRLSDTRLTFHGEGDHSANIFGGYYGESRGTAGDMITVTDFRSETLGGGEYSNSGLYVQGSSGDDTIRFTGIDLMHVGTGGLNFASLDLFGSSGFDRLDATGVTISTTGPADSYQFFMSNFWCEDIRFRDWYVAITSQLDFSFGLLPFQPSFLGVHNLELRDVRMRTPEGGGNIRIDQMDPDTGEVGFATNILFDNLQIDQEVESPFGLSCMYESYSGDDTIRIRNSRMPNFGVYGYDGTYDGSTGSGDVLIESSELGGLGLALDFLAETDDTVRIRNSTIRDEATVRTYGGNDSIQVIDSMFGGRLNVEGGAGDDGITVTGCTFTGSPMIEIMGDSGYQSYYSAAGDDTIRVRNCTLDAYDPDGVGISGYFYIVGDYIDGPDTFVGGNDVIELSDITATSSSTAYSDLSVIVYGASVSGGGTLIGGDDEITVRNVRLHSTGVGVDSFASAFLDVTGGIVSGNGTLIGDNTHLRVRDIEMVAGGDGGSDAWARVAGEVCSADYFSNELPTVIGGNDEIEVANCDFRSDGYFSASVNGELGINQLCVIGGNDVITLTGINVVSAQPFGFGVSGESGTLVDSSGLSDTISLRDVSLRQVSLVPVEYGDVELIIYADMYGTAGDDRVTLDNVTTEIVAEVLYDTYEWVWVFAEGGNDEVVIRNCSGKEFFVSLGDGDDAVTVKGVETERLFLLGEAGDDELTVRESTFTTLFADLGDGDDTATLINNTATESIAVNGGSGFDMLFVWNNVTPMLVFEGFED